MTQAALFPGMMASAAGRCAPRREPQPRRITPAVIDRLRWIDGRRTLTTTVGLSDAEINELTRAVRFGPIVVRFRISTPDRRLSGILDPHAPAAAVRLASLRTARRAGLVAGVVLAPLIPGVNTREIDLRELFAAARESAAAFVASEIVTPGAPRRNELLRLLRSRYPRIAARYEVWLRTSNRSPSEERAQIEALLGEFGRRFGLPREPDGTAGRPGSALQRRFSFAGSSR